MKLNLYDALGREVRALIHEEKPPGNYTVEVNAGALARGVYYTTLEAGSQRVTKICYVLK